MRKLLVLPGLALVAAVVAKKLAETKAQPVWHTPDPDDAPPSPAPRPAEAPPQAVPDLRSDDAAGASLDEALADSVEEPHEPTTPDAPAESVDLTRD